MVHSNLSGSRKAYTKLPDRRPIKTTRDTPRNSELEQLIEEEPKKDQPNTIQTLENVTEMAPPAKSAKMPQWAPDNVNVTGTEGKDVIRTFERNDLVQGDPEQATGAPDLVCINKGDDSADGNARLDKIDGGKGDDFLTGGFGDDAIIGYPDNDTIDEDNREGADTVKGGPGDDTITEDGDGAIDAIECGRGTDTVTADLDDKVAKDCENVTLPAATISDGR